MICTLKFIGVFYFEGCYRKLLPRTPPDLTRLRSARRSGALRVLPLRFSSRLRPRTRRRGILFHVELVECVPATWLWSEGVNVPSVWREVAEGNEERGESAVTSSPPPPRRRQVAPGANRAESRCARRVITGASPGCCLGYNNTEPR